MKKKLLLLIPSLALVGLFGLASCGKEGKKGKTYYISPTGTLEGKGTKASPMDAHTGFSTVQSGDTLKVLPGTYELLERIYVAQSGDAGKYITVENDSETERAIFDFHQLEFAGTNRGISVNGNYWHFNNIEVTGAGDNGMYIGGSHNIIENCQFYENRDTGLQLGRAGGGLELIRDWPSYNLIKNCTSYNNYDDETFGENADGFAAKLTVGYGNVFDGCIAYRNSDDGWDLFAKVDSGNIGTVILYNCVSFENGFLMNKTTEAGVERFITRDGDGIGFKLGGSTMKGDVILNNCVTFNNRLQGVGDNSNPGVISVNNVTAYNNCAAIDENGAIIKDGSNDKESSNFDLARSTASYNNYSNLLSYATNTTVQADRFLGSMRNSVMYMGAGEYTKFDAPVDASTFSGNTGEKYEGMSDSIFKSVTAPNGLNNRDIHTTLRNPDGSVQLGDFLSLKDGELKSAGVGADLTKTSYEDYKHYTYIELDENLTDDQQRVISVYSALEVNCNPEAVFQDMLVTNEMNRCKIHWISSDPSIISVGETPIVSFSSSSEILLTVYRPEKDTEVTLTAEIEYNNVRKTKTFKLNVVKDNPSIGNVEVEGVEYGMMIVDQFGSFEEPKILVTNGASYSGKELSKDLYELKKTYKYAVSTNDVAYPVNGVYTSKEGVYTIEYEIQSKINENDVKKGSYLVYVTSPDSPVDVTSNPKVSASRDGFLVSATLSNVTGHVYTYASTNAVETVETILANGDKFEFRNNRVDLAYNHSNSDGYFVHTIVTNKAESIKSQVYTTEIKKEEISSEADLLKLLTSGSADTSTIYLLTKDLDFSETDWNGEATFKG
ncbi:MAG: right-handed parallel beta-helix repeat-containing protein, partial [Anaeroplasmataceae bacterium]|nr:right-handed parallel beta-helix repeat-containing protein [Anaeroplasmataceae bacterium]